MKNTAQIPELRQTRLQKLIELFTMAPSMVLSNLFGTDNWDSEDIAWESTYGNQGMTPFSGENVEAPRVAPTGTTTHTAKAAFWKEKMYLGAKFLNNIREPGTQTHYQAQKYLAKQTKMLRNRCDRRKEWMHAKMIDSGAISYKDADGNTLSVDYGIPDANQVTLGATAKWNYTSDDSITNILEDIMNAQTVASNTINGPFTHAIFTQEVLSDMILDPSIQLLLQKSTFGNGDLFTRPKQVIGSLLNIPNMIQYDASFQLKAWLTAALAAGAGPHTIYADNLSDYEVGMTVKMVNVPLKVNNTEDLTITAVDVVAGTLTATGTLTRAYVAGRDYCFVTKKFIDNKKFILFSPTVDGAPIAEFGAAPFGMNRSWGMYVDEQEKWDPDGVFIRVQNKGLPVLYNPDAIYQMIVRG